MPMTMQEYDALKDRMREVLEERDRVKRERDEATRPYTTRIRELDAAYDALMRQKLAHLGITSGRRPIPR